MALTKCNVPGDVIGSLATRAEERGLTTQEFKDKFDEMPEGIKQYINEVLTEEIDAHIADYLAHKADNVHQKEVHGLKIEKGTWTPVLVGSTVAGTHTYSLQVGRYTKIDNLVYISMRLTITSIDSNASGNLNIAGLPFIAISEDTGLSISSLMNIHIAEEFKFVFARTLPSSSRIELVRVRADTALPSRVPISDAETNPSAEIRLSGVYETN